MYIKRFCYSAYNPRIHRQYFNPIPNLISSYITRFHRHFLNFDTHNGLFYTVPRNAWEMILRNLQFIAIFYEFCTFFIAQPNWINHLTRLWAIFKTTQVWNCYSPAYFSMCLIDLDAISYRPSSDVKPIFERNFRIPERWLKDLVSLSFIICCNTNLVIV